MKTKRKLLFVVSMCFGSMLFAQNATINYRVIPLPQSIKPEDGASFVLDSNVSIEYSKTNAMLMQNAHFLSEYIKVNTGISVKVNKKKTSSIQLILDPTVKTPEGYKLSVKTNKIIISASTEQGIFYGIQTLRKSIPVNTTSKVELPLVTIEDSPRFSYRGVMLDVGRYFYPVEFIKKYINLLALHNVNKMHWHLTEDQGWRIEIKKYPNLTKIGSIRKETVIGKNTGKYDGKEYGGYYTQKEIKEIVNYAKARYITIIPEIDMPGHMLAAIASYPELGCTGGSYEVGKWWGVYDQVLCVGKENTMKFIEDVLSEIIDLFPSEYIHIGGDECPKSSWKKCENCQAKIKELGLISDSRHSAEDRLQSYYINQTEKFLNSKGRKIIGWDEILEGGLAPNATVMSWRGISGGIEAAKQKHDVIMTPNSHMYFDHYQSKDKNEPLAIGGFLPIEKVYSYEPLPTELGADEQKHILGVQANVWTEYIPTTEHVEYMTLPRLAALCEVQWTRPEQKDYTDFLKRIPSLLDLYKANKYRFAPHILEAAK